MNTALSDEWSKELAGELAGIVDCTHTAEQSTSQEHGDALFQTARFNLIPSKQEPVAKSALSMARKAGQQWSVDQNLAIEQNRELAELLSRYIQPELEQSTTLTRLDTEGAEAGAGRLFMLETLEGDSMLLKIGPSANKSDKGSIMVKIDYVGNGYEIDSEAVAALRTALVTAFTKAAPEFIRIRDDHKRILGDSPPPPPRPGR